jgi:acetyl esterase
MNFPAVALSRVPVWMWRLLMAHLTPREKRLFNLNPIESVDYVFDVDYVGDGLRAHRLDVMVPTLPAPASAPAVLLPVYIYFHGGGWTSGDKEPLTKYCASQAADGMMVVNANYRLATRFQMGHMLRDANATLRWVSANAERFGADPGRIVLGGDSAGGQIAALLAASLSHRELREHYRLDPVAGTQVRGVVQHCSMVDFEVLFEQGFVLSLDFVRMLLPRRGKGLILRTAARYLSPIEWLGPDFPPVLVTTSEQDYFYRANLGFVRELQRHGVRVETLIFNRSVNNARHTWQQNPSFPESQTVYRQLQHFVHRVTRNPLPA